MAPRLLNENGRPTKLTLIGGSVVILLVIGGIASAFGYEPSTTSAGLPAAAPSSMTATPDAPTPAESSPESTAASSEPLAPRVEADLKNTWSVTNFTDGLAGEDGHDPALLNWYISQMTDDSPGIVHVTVQVTSAETTDTEVKQLAMNIMRLEQDAFPELDWVVVQTADGKILEQTQRLGA